MSDLKNGIKAPKALIAVLGWTFLAANLLPVTLRAEAVNATAPEKTLVYVVTKGTTPIPNSDRLGINEAQVREVAEAGFNVISVSAKAKFDLNRIRDEARLAEKHGLRYLGWTRGKTGAGDGPKLVWEDGSSQADASPNSDVLWSWLNEIILGYAQVSREIPALFGVMVDFENYHRLTKSQIGNLYPLSYDEGIFDEFAKARNLLPPQLDPAQRKTWLDEENLHEAFSEFQIKQWRERCRRLRAAIDKINPRFQFFILPAESRSPFMTEAVFAEWATKKAPLTLCSEATYGRITHLSPQTDSLSRNRKHVSEFVAFLQESGVHFRFLSGVDPIVRGADPEFCARNAVAISELGDGYWVFAEMPEHGSPDYLDYMTWFRRANTAIKAKDWSFQNAARETLHPLLRAHVGLEVTPFSSPSPAVPSAKTAMTTRAGQTYVVLLEKGDVLRGRVEVIKARKQAPPAEFVIADPEGRELYYDGDAQPGRPSTFEIKAEQTGLHAIAATAGKNHIKLYLENPYAGLLVPKQGVKLMHAQPPIYFFSLPGATSLEIGVYTAWHGKAGQMELYDPSGVKVASAPLVQKRLNTVRAEVSPAHAGKPWKILFTEGHPGEDLRDIDLILGKGCSPILTVDPTKALISAGAAKIPAVTAAPTP